jgi:hypothetical protein
VSLSATIASPPARASSRWTTNTLSSWGPVVQVAAPTSPRFHVDRNVGDPGAGD